MAAGADEKWTIDKLDGTNWTTWKFQMKHLLLAKELWGIVDGTERLAEDAEADARAAFGRRSQKAFSVLVLAINSSQLYLVTSSETPSAAWTALRNHFERDTLANKLLLKKQYFRSEMRDGTSIEKHLKSMKELTDKLAAIGAAVEEEDQVVTLLGSLPKNYSTLVTALEARDNISLDYVQQALVREELKLRGQVKREGDSALMGDRKRRTPNSKKPVCYGCQKPGHFRRDCPELVKNKKAPTHKADTAGEEKGSAFLVPDSSTQAERWLIDSGASSHMTWNPDLLIDYQQFTTPEKVGLGDGRTVDALGVGNVRLEMKFKVSKSQKSVLYKVLFVPQLACNLFSVRASASKGNFIKFGHTRCWIRNRTGKLCGMGTIVDKLYQLDCETIGSERAATASQVSTIDTWHLRLGHASEQCIKKMAQKKLAAGIRLPKGATLSFCEGCVAGKMTRKSFKPVGEIRSKKRLQLIHSDVCGPMPTESIGGHKYFVTFIDDYSRCCAVYFLKNKSEVPEKYKEFEARVSIDCDRGIGTLRSDNGGEYLSKEFESYLQGKGVRHELTVPYSPEQNGVAERMNRTLMESARSMMTHASLPDKYWAEAVEAAAYIRNRTLTTALKGNKSPLEVWSGRKPDVSNLRVFGCIAYAHIPDARRQKLDKKAEKFRFVGYSIQSKGYRLLDEETGKVYIRRDVVFNEQDFGIIKHSTTEVDISSSTEPEPPQDTEQVEQQNLRRSERRRRPTVRFGIDEYMQIQLLLQALLSTWLIQFTKSWNH